MATQDLTIDSARLLIQSSDLDQQCARLREQGWYTPESLARLFELAGELASVALGDALALAQLCANAAELAGWLNQSAQATYLCAQIQSARAQLDAALQLIESARQKYLAVGNVAAALRTEVGRINVLRELGRTAEAIALGREVLSAGTVTNSAGESANADALQPVLRAKIQNNLGLCYEELGQYQEALQCWTAAESIFQAESLTDEAGSARNNRGLVYLKLGRAEDALHEFEAAATAFDDEGLPLNYAQTQMNLGAAHFMLDDPGRGLTCLEASRQILESLGASADSLVLLLDTADAYLALNLHDEALRAYERAASQLEHAGMQAEHARASLGTSSALIAQGQYRKAALALRDFAIDPGETVTPTVCKVMMNRALALAGIGAQAEAMEAAESMLSGATAAGWTALQAQAHVILADLLANVSPAKVTHLEQARVLAQQLAWSSLLTRIYQRLGRAYLQNGREEQASQLLLEAVNAVEQSRATLTEDPYRVAYLRDKADAFDDLVQMHIQRGFRLTDQEQRQQALRQAFAIAERAKSRALLDRMAGAQSSGAPGSGAPGSGMQSPTTADFETVRANLQADTLLLYYYVCGEDICAMLISPQHDQIECVPFVGRVSDVQHLLNDLTVQWERFLVDQHFVSRYGRQLELSTQRVLQRLYQALFARVEPLIRAHSQASASPDGVPLLIVPHSVLHQVPFHALHDGTRYLIDQYALSYAPSATIYLISQQRTTPTAGSALIMGIDEVGIPQAIVEARSVADQLPAYQVDLFTGEAATTQHFREYAPQAGIIHLACHGQFRHDNPMFSSLQLSDGRLTAADVARLPFNHAIVALSACESGRGQTIAGDEVLGLPRAFLGSGASSVLVGLWLVHDRTAAELMTGWYRRLHQGLPRVQALRDVQLALRRQHPHPYYWAPFMLVGQR